MSKKFSRNFQARIVVDLFEDLGVTKPSKKKKTKKEKAFTLESVLDEYRRKYGPNRKSTDDVEAS